MQIAVSESGKKARKTIVIVSTRYPYPVVGGDRLRIFEIARALSRDYDLILLAMCDTHAEYVSSPPEDGVFKKIIKVKRNKWVSWLQCLRFPFCSRPLQGLYYVNRRFLRAVLEAELEADALLFHLIRLDWYKDYVVKPVILEMTDAISMNYQRILSEDVSAPWDARRALFSLEAKRLLRLEKNATHRYSLSVLVSDVDRKYLSEGSAGLNDRTIVVANGVDASTLPFQGQRDGFELVFIANMSSYQNFEAAHYLVSEILPRIKLRLPQATVKLIGRIPDSAKQKLSVFDSVTITGEVPSVPPAASSGAIGVCPVRLGAGVQNKVLEYMALGLPTVTTEVGSEGLDGQNGVHYLVAQDADAFSGACIRLLTDRKMRQEIANNARTLIQSQYGWDAKMGPLITAVGSVFEQSGDEN